jgi:hypothetical protein
LKRKYVKKLSTVALAKKLNLKKITTYFANHSNGGKYNLTENQELQSVAELSNRENQYTTLTTDGAVRQENHFCADQSQTAKHIGPSSHIDFGDFGVADWTGCEGEKMGDGLGLDGFLDQGGIGQMGDLENL